MQLTEPHGRGYTRKRASDEIPHPRGFLRGENADLAALSGTNDLMQWNHRAGEVSRVTRSHA